MHRLIIFASGTGSNAQAIIDHFRDSGKAEVVLIVSNKAEAGVLQIAQKEKIPFLIVDRHTLSGSLLLNQLETYQPSLIVLAGFLWKIPEAMTAAYSERIINIHPALLPDFGGKGMYGMKVHEAVLHAERKESGITIHYVNEVYDSGDIILQARCMIHPNDDAASLAQRIHRLEHFYYPRTIEFLLQQMTGRVQ